MIDGEQYVAVFAAAPAIPYGNSVTQGDSLWAFKLGGTYTTESGSQEAPTPAPLTIRRPVERCRRRGRDGRQHRLPRADEPDRRHGRRARQHAQNGMQPTHLRVPVGTTVTFLNPGAETFPNFPNLKPHCATQFFEGLFNVKLHPGETLQYTFDRAGEYFFNDCTDPRPTGKIEVYLVPQDQPGALKFTPGTLDLGSDTGLFTGVDGKVSAHFELPAGYTYESGAVLVTPLSATPIPAEKVTANKNRIIVQFDEGRRRQQRADGGGDADPAPERAQRRGRAGAALVERDGEHRQVARSRAHHRSAPVVLDGGGFQELRLHNCGSCTTRWVARLPAHAAGVSVRALAGMTDPQDRAGRAAPQSDVGRARARPSSDQRRSRSQGCAND